MDANFHIAASSPFQDFLIFNQDKWINMPDEWRNLFYGMSFKIARKKASTAELIFNDELGVIKGLKLLQEGTPILLYFGYATWYDTFGPFVIKDMVSNYDESGRKLFVCKLHDKSSILKAKTKNRKFADKNLVETIKEIADSYGLGYNINDPELADDEDFSEDAPMIQAGMTDAQIMSKISHKFGYVWWVDGDVLHFQRDKESDKEAKRLDWKQGNRLIKTFALEQRKKESNKDSTHGKSKRNSGVNVAKGETYDETSNMADMVKKAEEYLKTSEDKFKQAVGKSGEEKDKAEEKAKAEAANDTIIGKTMMFVDDITGKVTRRVYDKETKTQDAPIEKDDFVGKGNASAANSNLAKRQGAEKLARGAENVKARCELVVPIPGLRPWDVVLCMGIEEAGRYKIVEMEGEMTEGSAPSMRLLLVKKGAMNLSKTDRDKLLADRKNNDVSNKRPEKGVVKVETRSMLKVDRITGAETPVMRKVTKG